MPKTIIKIKTWSCACGYSQDFEPTQENQNKHFNSDVSFRISDLKANSCPSCALKGVAGTLALERDPNKKMVISIIGEEEIEDELNPDTKTELVHKMPINTKAQKDSYREKRRQDITEAIIYAKGFEDKE